MSGLSGSQILIGVTGGVAAYKSADLVRRLIERGATVRVAMTSSAKQFISPLTMQAVSGHPVHEDLLNSDSEAGMGHIELARWADQVVVAPATADFIARLAAGLADDLLSTLCLATEATLSVAPAMNRVMWCNPATQRNITTLKDRGISVLGPDIGSQACGETGPGRMMEPGTIVYNLESDDTDKSLEGTSVLVTAGPTWEAFDPVRVLTNHSSGKMGYAIAGAAREAGATVTLVSGPTTLAPPPKVVICNVTTALEMLSAVEERITSTDIFISVAAVSDYRPGEKQPQKIKKQAATINVELVRNPDILATVAAYVSPPFTVGFAAETEAPVIQARQKLDQKNVDMIIANQVGGNNNPFGSDQNDLILVDRQGETDLGQGTKTDLAERLILEIALRYHEKHSAPDT